MAATDPQVQTVEIPEPSDKHEVAHDEKPCFTKKHLYIAIGVVFVVAISLIGSLLDFSPSEDGVSEASIEEATRESWPEFDLNGDGFVDKAEFTKWATGRIAARKRFTTSVDPEPVQTLTTSDGENGSEPTAQEIDTHFAPMDFNHDGRISLGEAILWAIMQFRRALENRQDAPLTPMESKAVARPQEIVSDPGCPVPQLPGFPGKVTGPGWVGACQPGFQLWCQTSCFCRHKRKCHRNVIEISWTTTSTCCGDDQAANCTGCTCGGTYRFVPRGRHNRARALCHWLSTYQCGDTNTGVPVW